MKNYLEHFEKTTAPVSKFEAVILGLSPLMIYFAWDTSFNMQVMLPIIAILTVFYLIKRPAMNKSTLFCMILIMAIAAIGTLREIFIAPDIISSKSLTRVLYLAEILLFYLVMTDRKWDKSELRLLLTCIFISGAIISTEIIFNWAGGMRGKIGSVSFFGAEISENYEGALIAFLFIISITTLIQVTQFKAKLLLSIVSFLLFFSLLLTASRAAVIATVIGMIVLAYQFFKKSRKKTLTKIIIICVSVVAIVVAVPLLLELFNTVLPSFTYKHIFEMNLDDSSNSNRLKLWEFGIAGFLEQPLLGYGIGNYNYYVVNDLGMVRHVVVVAHNTYLDVLLDIGLLGAACVSVLLLRGTKGAIKGRILIPAILVLSFTAFIVGGERTFFLWFGIVIITVLAQYNERNGEGSLAELLDLKIETVENEKRK